MEIDADFELTARVFQKGVKANHQIILNMATATIEVLQDTLRSKLQLSRESGTLEVVHCGVPLTDLNHVRNGSSINVIVKDNSHQYPRPMGTRAEFSQILAKLFNPEYQYMTRTVITTTNTVNEIIDKLPYFREDLVAQGILKNFNVLKTIIQKENKMYRLYTEHPSIADALYHLSEVVVSRADQDTDVYRSIPRQNNHQYTIDGMSDDDEEAEPPRPQTHRITANQLAAAIAGARDPSTSSSSSQAGASTSSNTSTQSRGTPAMQRGVQVSEAGAVSADTNRASGTTEKYSSQLAQILSMGIADRKTALHALEAAGGDVNLAVDLIYGGDMT